MWHAVMLSITSNSFNASFNMAPGSKEPILNTPTEAAMDYTQGTLEHKHNNEIKLTHLGPSAEIHRNIC